MRKMLAAVSPIAGAGGAATAGPVEEAARLGENWIRAFNASDVDAIVSLYAPDALFFGTGSTSLVTQASGIRAYFAAALLTNRPRSAVMPDPTVQVLSDTTVIVTGLDTMTGVQDGRVVRAHGRTSFVVGKRDDGWQIVHFHRSAMPD